MKPIAITTAEPASSAPAGRAPIPHERPGRDERGTDGIRALLPHLASIIILVGATFAFMGTTYEQERLSCFGLDAAVVGPDRSLLAIDGAIAFLYASIHSGRMLGGFAAAIAIGGAAGILIAVALTRLGVKLPEAGGDKATMLARYMVWASGAGAVLVMILGGPDAGCHEAEVRIARVRAGAGFDYATPGGTIHGLVVAADKQRMWILARDGLHPVAVADLTGPIGFPK